MTPGQIQLAIILAAWETWPDSDEGDEDEPDADPVGPELRIISRALHGTRYAKGGFLTAAGDELVARARRGGHLPEVDQ